jgi:hypothetical protein
MLRFYVTSANEARFMFDNEPENAVTAYRLTELWEWVN